MNNSRKAIVALSVLLTTLNAVVPCRAATSTDHASSDRRASGPIVVATKAPLSPQQIAQYRQKSAQARAATKREAAGASDNTVWWVLGGIVVVAGVIALASGGGGGGGGGGY